jgi:hypothetical protein
LGNDSWHTYGVLWSPAGYTFYYDDTPIWTASQAVSARPEYMILSSEVRNAGWAGSIPAAGYGSLAASVTDMQVDSVRASTAVPEPATAVVAMLCALPPLLRRRRPRA